MVTLPLVIFLMLKPTVGIMSSEYWPDAIKLTNVVLPEFWRPTSVSSISSFQNKLLNQSSTRWTKANIFSFRLLKFASVRGIRSIYSCKRRQMNNRQTDWWWIGFLRCSMTHCTRLAVCCTSHQRTTDMVRVRFSRCRHWQLEIRSKQWTVPTEAHETFGSRSRIHGENSEALPFISTL